DAFAEFGVTAAQIETRIQRRLEAIRPAQVVGLRKVYNSLRDGMSVAADWFDANVPLADPAGETQPETGAAPRRTRARRGNAETQSEPADKASQAPTSPEQPAALGAGVPPAEPDNVGSQTVNPPPASPANQTTGGDTPATEDPGAAARRLT